MKITYYKIGRMFSFVEVSALLVVGALMAVGALIAVM